MITLAKLNALLASVQAWDAKNAGLVEGAEEAADSLRAEYVRLITVEAGHREEVEKHFATRKELRTARNRIAAMEAGMNEQRETLDTLRQDLADAERIIERKAVEA